MWHRCSWIGVIFCSIAVSSSAQSYPNKTVRLVTYNAGGANDFTARLIARAITGPLGQPVIVDNRTGGVVPGEIVSKSTPDGYTLLVAGVIYSIGHLLEDTPYDPIRDFEPISTLGKSPLILVVHPSIPVRTVSELIAFAKRNPGVLNYANGGIGGGTHLASELFKSMAGNLDITRIDYKTGAPAIIGLLSGECDMMFVAASTGAPHIKSGKLRALAVTSATPSALAPGLAPMADTLPGFEADYWSMIVAPARTPAAIITRLNQEIVRILNQPDVKQSFLSVGLEAGGSTPEQATAAIKSEIARMGKVIKDAGIRVN